MLETSTTFSEILYREVCLSGDESLLVFNTTLNEIL